jgi:hypothetical protein
MDNVPTKQEQEENIMTEKIRQQFLSAARLYLLPARKAGESALPARATPAAACCWMRDWPLPETLGVFVSVLGFDWMTQGRAQAGTALAGAIIAGIAILVFRRWRRHRK